MWADFLKSRNHTSKSWQHGRAELRRAHAVMMRDQHHTRVASGDSAATCHYHCLRRFVCMGRVKQLWVLQLHNSHKHKVQAKFCAFTYLSNVKFKKTSQHWQATNIFSFENVLYYLSLKNTALVYKSILTESRISFWRYIFAARLEWPIFFYLSFLSS